MRLVAAALALALLTGCASAPSCFVGMSLFPPGPVVMCGADFQDESADDLDV